MTDFFFRNLRNDNGSLSISWSDFHNTGKTVTPEFFVKQLNRLLKDNGRVLRVHSGTSYADINEILSVLEPGGIGYAHIGARTDINPNVTATLDCTLCLDEGTLLLTPHWCAYKEIRADEIVSCLIKPLANSTLKGRVYAGANNEKDRLNLDDLEASAKVLFALSGYPGLFKISKESGRVMGLTEIA